jgi:hypothetical protein
MSSHQGCERGPCLSAWWNVLPLFFANYALPRRDTARRVLGAAGSANERFHISVPGGYGLCTLIIDRPRPASLGFTTFREVRQPYERQICDDSGGSPHLLARFQCLDPGVTTISVAAGSCSSRPESAVVAPAGKIDDLGALGPQTRRPRPAPRC